MFKFYSIIFCALFSTACATSAPDKITISAAEKLQPMVNEFFSYCTMYLSRDKCFPKIDLRVRINKLPENILGQCTVYDKPEYLRIIEIQPDVVENYNFRAVMYHELFHCVLNKPHFDGEVDIMNAYEHEEHTKIMYDNWETFVRAVLLRD